MEAGRRMPSPMHAYMNVGICKCVCIDGRQLTNRMPQAPHIERTEA